MLKVKDLKNLKKLGVFAGGVLFGTAGIAVLASKDAKKLYTQCTAAVLRGKDSEHRLRLRVPKEHMSMHQADLLEYYLKTIPGVKNAAVDERTGHATIEFTRPRSNAAAAQIVTSCPTTPAP